MTWLSPGRLWLLVLVAALAAAYAVLQARRQRFAVRFANLDLLASVAPRRPGWRRHLPAAALLGALVSLTLAFARPARDVKVPREEATVVLAIDTSTSMEATDVEPSRLEAAQRAAAAFVDELPERIRLGLVTFSGSARVVVPPTSERAPVEAALDRLSLGPRTAIGEAIFTALDAVALAATVENVPARIVVLSDGATTTGRSNGLAARAAADAGVPVSTIAFGTDEGVVTSLGRPVGVPVDEDALRAIADATGGSFFEAESGEDLREVYEDLSSVIGFTTERREVTSWFTGVGLALALAAAAGSLVWMGRFP